MDFERDIIDSQRISKYTEHIRDILDRHMPLTNDQFDYYMNIHMLSSKKRGPMGVRERFLVDSTKLNYTQDRNITPSPKIHSWEIQAKIEEGITQEELEKALIECEIIEDSKELEVLHYDPNPGHFGSGLSAIIENKDLKIKTHFSYSLREK